MGQDQTTVPHRGRLTGTTPIAERATVETPSKSRVTAVRDDREIGGYAVQQQLGAGGMGEVFLCVDEALGRRIAVKRIRAERAAEEDARRRFAIEAQITAMLQHPSVIPVYSYADDGTYYTMRPVEGVTLSELLGQLRDEPPAVAEWPTARLVRLFLQAANAVAYAHSRGVIHRDLKPSNIMIGPFEEVLVLDWGMAKVVEDLAEETVALRQDPGDSGDPVLVPNRRLTADTASKVMVGTPAYMAPEQLRGDGASYLSDVFALGLILYELLALRRPWPAHDLQSLVAAMHTPPEIPSRLKLGRAIPHQLARVALRALAFDPDQRHPSVAEFSRAVAHALEGRAEWRPEPKSLDRREWRLAGGKQRLEDGDRAGLVLQSRGTDRFRYFCVHSPGDDVRIELEVSVKRGVHELSVWLNAADPRDDQSVDGYELLVLPARRRTRSLTRSGRVVAGARSQLTTPRRWYKIVAERADDRFTLRIDDEEVYAYHDPIPLTGGFVGLTGRSAGVRIRGLRVLARGTSATVSCLKVPEAFFNRGQYEHARAEFERIATGHPGRAEGRLAGFRAGLCSLEVARQQPDPDLRALALEEADETFVRHAAANDSCLLALGRAMVAGERGDSAAKRAALAAALDDHADDPHLAAVHEWLLGRLHAASTEHRRTVAELVPLALDHCLHGWGSRVVRELIHDVRRDWEQPAFLLARAPFKDTSRMSVAEAKMFFGFWSGRAEVIEAALGDLRRTGSLEPRHASDAVFCLLELGAVERARKRLAGLPAELAGPRRTRRLAELAWSAALAASGEVDEACARLTAVGPEPLDRSYNSARLWLARALDERGRTGDALRLLEPARSQDRFGPEHRAWLLFASGDVLGCQRALVPFVERGDHRTGRNLVNLLHGATLLARDRDEEAVAVFNLLRPTAWPRTWRLGSHYAAGRLGGGDLDTWWRGAFPWERGQLRRQAALLASARGEPTSSLPEPLGGVDGTGGHG